MHVQRSPSLAGAVQSLSVIGLSLYVGYLIGRTFRRRGGFRRFFPGLFSPRQGQQQQQPGASRPSRPRATLDQVAEALQHLPTDIFCKREDLEHMTAHELKVRLLSVRCLSGEERTLTRLSVAGARRAEWHRHRAEGGDPRKGRADRAADAAVVRQLERPDVRGVQRGL